MMEATQFETAIKLLDHVHTAKLFFTDRGHHVLYGYSSSQIILDPTDLLGKTVERIIVNEWRRFDDRVKHKYKNPAIWDPAPPGSPTDG